MFSAYLSNGEADEFARSSEMIVVAGNDSEHQSRNEEALDLDPTTAENFDEVDCQEIARYVPGCGNDQIAVTVLEKSVVFGLAFREADGCEEDRLVKIDSVKRYVDQEPC